MHYKETSKKETGKATNVGGDPLDSEERPPPEERPNMQEEVRYHMLRPAEIVERRKKCPVDEDETYRFAR